METGFTKDSKSLLEEMNRRNMQQVAEVAQMRVFQEDDEVVNEIENEDVFVQGDMRIKATIRESGYEPGYEPGYGYEYGIPLTSFSSTPQGDCTAFVKNDIEDETGIDFEALCTQKSKHIAQSQPQSESAFEAGLEQQKSQEPEPEREKQYAKVEREKIQNVRDDAPSVIGIAQAGLTYDPVETTVEYVEVKPETVQTSAGTISANRFAPKATDSIDALVDAEIQAHRQKQNEEQLRSSPLYRKSLANKYG